MKKRLVSLLATAVLVITVFAGCLNQGASDSTGPTSPATPATDGEEKIELEFFNMKKQAENIYNDLIKEFQEEYPNIIVKQVSPSDEETVFFTRVATNDIPDIMSLYPAETPYQVIMEEGIVAELTDDVEFLSRATDAALEYSRYQGKLYAMPFAISAWGIYCNVDMFEDAGVDYPSTWDELLAACEALKSHGVEYPIVFSSKSLSALGQEGERHVGIIKNDIYLDCEQVGLGNGSFLDADKNWFRILGESMLEVRQYAPDTVALGREQAIADFVNGENAMFVGGTFSYAGIIDADPDMNVLMIPVPNPDRDGTQSLPINVDIATGYSAASPYPEECLKFLEFLSRPEVYQRVVDVEGTPPVIKGVEYNFDALMPIKEEIESGDTFLTVVNFWPAGFRNEWAIHLQNMLVDQDVELMLAETDRICKELYAQ